MNTISKPLITSLFFFAAICTHANPQGGNVVHGSASISHAAPGHLQINQSTNKAIIDWQSFSINAGEHTQFIQPDARSIALNRVLGGDASHIFGRLSANGRLMLINPRGIWFGPGSVIDVAGLIASTNNITNENFLANRYVFEPLAEDAYFGSVINDGTITVKDKGLVALMAPGVANHGLIRANMGTVILGSGNAFTLDFFGDELIHFAIDKPISKPGRDQYGEVMLDGVSNTGEILADGGKVILSAKAAANVVENVISVEGLIQANGVATHNGKIHLLGNKVGRVKVNGALKARNTYKPRGGGQIHITGQEVYLGERALLDASGDWGGGEILMGGDYQGQGDLPKSEISIVDFGAVVKADALRQGDGGKVIIWSDGYTGFGGEISAVKSGDAHAGGFIEISGKTYLDVKSDNIHAGHDGTILFDPFSLTITAAVTNFVTGTSPFTPTGTGAPATLAASILVSLLESGNAVIVRSLFCSGGGCPVGDADIIVDAPIVAVAGNGASSLTFQPDTGGEVFVNEAIQGPFKVVFDGIANFQNNGGVAVASAFATAAEIVFNAAVNVNDTTSLTGQYGVFFNDALNIIGGAVQPTTLTVNSDYGYQFNNPITGSGATDANLILNTTGPFTIGALNKDVIFENTITGLHDLIVTSASGSVTAMRGNTFPVLTLGVTGDLIFNSPFTYNATTVNITSDGAQFNQGFAPETVFTGGAAVDITTNTGAIFRDNIMHFDGLFTVNGPSTLDISQFAVATAVFGDPVTFNGDVTLTQDILFQNESANGASFHFNGDVTGPFDVVIKAPGGAFLGAGGMINVSSLDILSDDALSRPTDFTTVGPLPVVIKTTGLQRFTGNLNTNTDTTFDSDSGGQINPLPPLTWTHDGVSSITLSNIVVGATGSINLINPNFNNFSMDGGSLNLFTTNLSAGGTATFSGSPTFFQSKVFTAPNIVLTGGGTLNHRGLNFNGATSLGMNVTSPVLLPFAVNGNTTVTASSNLGPEFVTLNGNVNIDPGVTLNINGSGLNIAGDIAGMAGSGINLTSTANGMTLGTSAANTITGFASFITNHGVGANALTINSGTVTTPGVQTYNGDTLINNDINMTGSLISFIGDMLTGAAGVDLTLNGGAFFNLTSPLATFDSIVINGTTTLGNNTTFSDVTELRGNIDGGGFNLTILDNARFGGAAGAHTLSNINILDIDAVGTTITNFMSSWQVNQLSSNTLDLQNSLTINAGGAPNVGAFITVTGNGASDLAYVGDKMTLTNGSISGVKDLSVSNIFEVTHAGTTNIATTGKQTYSANNTFTNPVNIMAGDTVTLPKASHTVPGGVLVITAPLTVLGAQVVSAVADFINYATLTVNGNTQLGFGFSQSFTDALSLNGDVTLTRDALLSATNQIDIVGSVVGGTNSLDVNAPILNLGSGSGSSFTGLAVFNATGTTDFNLNTAAVTSTTSQTYTGNVDQLVDMVLTAPLVNLGGNWDGMNNDLEIISNTNLNANVANVDNFTLTGTTTINIASLGPYGTLTFNGPAILGTSTTIGAGTSSFTAGLDGVGNGIVINGASSFMGTVENLTNFDLNGMATFDDAIFNLNTPQVFDFPVMLVDNNVFNSNNDLSFLAALNGGNLTTFNLMAGNLLIDNGVVNTIGDVLINSVNNVTIGATSQLITDVFTQIAGTGTTDFGPVGLDTGLDPISITNNGDVNGNLSGGPMTVMTTNFNGNADATGDANITTTADSTGNIMATGMVTANVGGDLSGSVNAGGDAVIMATNYAGTGITATNIDITTTNNSSGDMNATNQVLADIGGVLSSMIMAGGPAVIVANSFNGQIDANSIDITTVGNSTGNMTAVNNVDANIGGVLSSVIMAGGPAVIMANSFNGQIDANSIDITTVGNSTGNMTAVNNVDANIGGVLSGIITAGGPANIVAASYDGQIDAGSIDIVTIGNSTGNMTSGDFINANIGGDLSGTLMALGDALIMANSYGGGNVTANNIDITTVNDANGNLTSVMDTAANIGGALNGFIDAGGQALVMANSYAGGIDAANIDITVVNNADGAMNSGNDILANIGGNLNSTLNAVNEVTVFANTYTGNITAGNTINLNTQGNALGDLNSGNTVNAMIGGDLGSNITSVNQTTVDANSYSGNITANAILMDIVLSATGILNSATFVNAVIGDTLDGVVNAGSVVNVDTLNFTGDINSPTTNLNVFNDLSGNVNGPFINVDLEGDFTGSLNGNIVNLIASTGNLTGSVNASRLGLFGLNGSDLTGNVLPDLVPLNTPNFFPEITLIRSVDGNNISGRFFLNDRLIWGGLPATAINNRLLHNPEDFYEARVTFGCNVIDPEDKDKTEQQEGEDLVFGDEDYACRGYYEE